MSSRQCQAQMHPTININQKMKPRNVFITGATGLVGMAIVDAAMSQGWGLTTTSRSELKRQGDQHNHIESDITSSTWCNEIHESIEACDVIVHAAANIDLKAPAEELWQSNVGGTINVLRLGQKWRSNQIVFISTLGIFSGSKGIVKEDDSVMPRGAYYKSKLHSEQILMLASDLGAVGNVAVLRISAPIGRGMPNKIGS